MCRNSRGDVAAHAAITARPSSTAPAPPFAKWSAATASNAPPCSARGEPRQGEEHAGGWTRGRRRRRLARHARHRLHLSVGVGVEAVDGDDNLGETRACGEGKETGVVVKPSLRQRWSLGLAPRGGCKARDTSEAWWWRGRKSRRRWCGKGGDEGRGRGDGGGGGRGGGRREEEMEEETEEVSRSPSVGLGPD